MAWSEEVHAQRLSAARRAASRQARGASQPHRAVSSLSHLALVTGALGSLVWWTRGGRQQCLHHGRRLPVIGPLLTRLLRRRPRGPSRKADPRRSQAQIYAGDAALRRAASQASALVTEPQQNRPSGTEKPASSQSQQQQGDGTHVNKRKNNKKKGRRR
ncbi:hypothetical protein WJX73_000659 [Symbiochloris irregularis]|uniref:Uncharacterized protein n=1 Tax=Symbiochloris irregularis TaxID=706552 RepID=A0AAW1PIG0_9CHLO